METFIGSSIGRGMIREGRAHNNSVPAHSRTKENPAIAARFSSPAWGRRRSPSRGNSCQHYGCHLGGWGNRIASQHHDYASALPTAQREAPHASHAKSGNVFAPFMQAYGEQQTLWGAGTA